MKYNGGIASFGYKDKIFIKRINGLNRTIEDVEFDKFKNFKGKRWRHS